MMGISVQKFILIRCLVSPSGGYEGKSNNYSLFFLFRLAWETGCKQPSEDLKRAA
jgi:hypothetical protein